VSVRSILRATSSLLWVRDRIPSWRLAGGGARRAGRWRGLEVLVPVSRRRSFADSNVDVDAGVSIHQVSAPRRSKDGSEDSDCGYDNEGFDDDEDQASLGVIAGSECRDVHREHDDDCDETARGQDMFIKFGRCAVCGQRRQCVVSEPRYCYPCASKTFHDHLNKGNIKEATILGYQIERLSRAEGQHALQDEEQNASPRPKRVDPNMIKHQLSILQEGWMKEGSMQHRIYRVAAQQLAKSILMDVLNECIGAADERRRKEESLDAERRRREDAGFQQPRTCDVLLAEKKKKKLEEKKKKDAERERRDAEISELAKEKAAKRRAEIKESEAHLAESKERFRKKREKSLQKFEEVSASLQAVLTFLSKCELVLCDPE